VSARRLAGVIEAIAEDLLLLQDAPRSWEVPADTAWLEGSNDPIRTTHRVPPAASENSLVSKMSIMCVSCVSASDTSTP
jgi:hypothetical protein